MNEKRSTEYSERGIFGLRFGRKDGHDMRIAIETEQLCKSYGKHMCVKNVDLRVPEGSIYGFLGPNGAGKSTTMKMILGLVNATRGQVSVFGKEMNRKNRLDILKQTGSLIESPSYYGHLTGRENLEIVRTLRGADKREVNEALKTVRMEKQQDKKAGAYSLGMKQRLGLAAALLGKPKILLLDEPTNGLDPAGIQEMRELIRSLPERYGMTVMVSSHLLSEIDQMATHTGIIHKGELIFQDSLEHLHEHSRKRLLLKTGNNEAALRILGELGCRGKMMEDRISLPDMEDEKVAFCIAALVRQDIGVLRVEEYQRNLEDIFLGLTGKQVSL